MGRNICKNNGIFKEREVARAEYLAVKDKYEATYEALKDSFYEDIIQTDDPVDLEYNKAQTRIYGSEANGYFEIDYGFADAPNELYIKIDEVTLED